VRIGIDSQVRAIRFEPAGERDECIPHSVIIALKEGGILALSRRSRRANDLPNLQTPRAISPPRAAGPHPLRFAGLFVFCALAGFALIQAPGVDRAVAAFTRGLVNASAALVNILGGDVLANDAVLESRRTGFAVRMANGCNALHVLIVLCSAMLAFPASAKQKTKGLLAAVLVIQAINLVRFISLFYLGQYAPAWFDFAHLYFWESMIMLDSLVIFWIWAQFAMRSGAHGLPQSITV